MSFLLSSNGRDFLCGAGECLSWILVLVSFLSIFYLAFCMFYKIDRVVRIIGYVWSGIITVVAILMVALHTCIFTLTSAVFVGLMLFAILYVLWGNRKIGLKIKTHDEVSNKESVKNTEAEEHKDEQVFDEVELYDFNEEVLTSENVDSQTYDELISDGDVAVESESVPDTYILDAISGEAIVVNGENDESLKPEIVSENISDDIETNERIEAVAEDFARAEIHKEEKPQEIVVNEPKVEVHQVVEPKGEVSQEELKKEPREVVVNQVKNKFTDIIVSQIEGMPEMEEKNTKSREELVKELENRPVMIKYQQVQFNNEPEEEPKEKKKKTKKEVQVQPEPQKINRGYQIDRIITD